MCANDSIFEDTYAVMWLWVLLRLRVLCCGCVWTGCTSELALMVSAESRLDVKMGLSQGSFVTPREDALEYEGECDGW